MGQRKHTTIIFLLHEIVSNGWHKQNRYHKPKIPPINWVYLALLRSQSLKKRTNSYEMIIIITCLTTNVIAAFNALYLLAARSHYFQLFLFSFWAEQVERGLRTM